MCLVGDSLYLQVELNLGFGTKVLIEFSIEEKEELNNKDSTGHTIKSPVQGRESSEEMQRV